MNMKIHKLHIFQGERAKAKERESVWKKKLEQCERRKEEDEDEELKKHISWFRRNAYLLPMVNFFSRELPLCKDDM